MRVLVVPGLCLLGACGPSATTPGGGAAGPQQPQAIEHDFGVIPHGESRQHDFPIDLSTLGPGWIPLRVHLDCSCGRGDLRIVGKGGERVLDGRPSPENSPGPGETLIARVILDTITKEAADLPMTASRGHVLLQRTDDDMGLRRLYWPLLLRFGIDAPVVMRPFTAFDFGRVPLSRVPEIRTSLRGDEQHPGVRFVEVTSTDPCIECTLEPAGDEVVLRARCRPKALGNHRAIVAVATDLPNGYRVHVDVTWKVVPDLEATPSPKISGRADLRREQRESEAVGQFVIVTDHDEQRPAEFVVREVVDAAGRDASASFSVTLRPVPGQARQHRLLVRYIGGYPDGFRGRIVLGKQDADDQALPIELVLFSRRDS